MKFLTPLILLVSMSAFAGLKLDAVKPLPIPKKKPQGLIHVTECQPGPPLQKGPSLYCKPVLEEKKK